MPGMNGIVLAERVRLGWPDTRVLFMSGVTHDNLQTRACSQPGVKVVVTPFTGRDLRAKVRELLDQRRSPFAREASGRSHPMRRDPARGAVAASVLAAHYARLSERCSPCRP